MQGDEISFIAGGLAYTGKVKGNVIEGTRDHAGGHHRVARYAAVSFSIAIV